MKTIGEVLKLGATFLQERGVDKPRRFVEEILSFVLGLKRLDLYLQFDRPMIEEELEKIRPLLKRGAQNEPFEYLVGQVGFMECQIKVSKQVLIPRPETEILAALIAKRLASLERKVVWDLCTGSGAIGIALKKALPSLEVTLADISPEALALAKENSEINQVCVEFVQGDLLQPFQGKQAEVVICNPPYLSTSEYLNAPPSVRDFEPKLALVGGDCGTEFYERLASDLPSYLAPSALVFLEIGSTQGELVKEIFSSPCWQNCKIEKDWAGHDRFFFLEKQ